MNYMGIDHHKQYLHILLCVFFIGSLPYCVSIIFSVLHIHQACASALVRIFNAIPSSSFSAALNCAR